jgi:hypothetical protein
MTVVAGIDVGNATTEVVLGRTTPAGVEVVAADRAPTRRAKGSAESLAGAVALVRRLERRHGVDVERAVAAPLRPVSTGSASVPEDRPATGRLRAVSTRAATTAGRGFGAGRPVRFGEPLTGEDEVVVVVPSGHRYDEVAEALTALAATGRLMAVLLEEDEAVLVANRLTGDVPVVDEVAPESVLGAVRVAVEVSTDGRPLQVVTDPLKLATALRVPDTEAADVAALVGRLFDATSAAVVLDDRAPDSPASPPGWIEVCGSRLSFLAGHARVSAGRVGDARAYAVPPGLRACAVDDLWTVDLAQVAATVLARRSPADERPMVLAALHATAPLLDPADLLAGLLGVPVGTATSEASAARAGALTTPGAPAEAVVVDLGGGTIDVVSQERAVVAAGAGDLLTAGVAGLTGASGAAAEWVKRGPAHRVEAPQVLLGEHGDRTFLDQPAPRDSVGSLVVRGPAGLLAFSATLAPGEWRALRLRLKTDLVGGNVARALRSLDVTPATVVVVGGSAGDDEVLAAVAGALPRGTAVGRGDVGGSLGHRYAVAYGLLRPAP